MKKKVLLYITIVVLILLFSLATLFCFLPLVVFVLPPSPYSFSSTFPHPSFFNLGYICVTRNDGEKSILEKIKDPSLVVYSSLSEIDPSFPSIVWGTDKAKGDYYFQINQEEMYSSLISEFSSYPIAFLFEESDEESNEIFNKLSQKYSNIAPVTYSGRISIVNKDEIVKTLDSFYMTVVLTVNSSKEGWRETTSRIAMDMRYASSIVSKDRVISLTPNWDLLISDFLSGRLDIPIYYTFSVIK